MDRSLAPWGKIEVVGTILHNQQISVLGPHQARASLETRGTLAAIH
jgi:hypothetical protein